MAAKRTTAASRVEMTEHRNEVRLSGRLADAATTRTLPSGDEIVTWRLLVDRSDAAASRGVDVIDCTAWQARLRRTALGWSGQDVIEVSGALRRRFWRGPGGLQSRCEVEVVTATKVRAGASEISRRRKTG